MAGKASWWLKLDRANEHLQELEAEIRRYADLRPYAAERRQQPKGQRNLWKYVIRFTKEPDPKIALIAGDAAHNIRTALDHLIVALSTGERRRSASFPIEDRPIWERRADGRFLVNDDQARNSFNQAIAGLSDGAIALVKELQPYSFAPHIADNALRVLRVLDNADKHREIIALRPGLLDTTCVLNYREVLLTSHGTGFRDDGAEIGQFNLPGVDPHSIEPEVQVEICGSLYIAVQIADVSGSTDVLELKRVLAYCRDDVCPRLEQHLSE